jgi:hypothetical protein
VKLEVKLYNIDKVNVANMYIEMQREGAILATDDFLSDITKRLNIESTNLIRT